jgi:hypothetical protein
LWQTVSFSQAMCRRLLVCCGNLPNKRPKWRLFVHTDAATLERRRQTHEHGIAWRPKQIDNEG